MEGRNCREKEGWKEGKAGRKRRKEQKEARKEKGRGEGGGELKKEGKVEGRKEFDGRTFGGVIEERRKGGKKERITTSRYGLLFVARIE